LILAVNKINEPQRTDIRIAGIGNAKARLIFENRIITVNDGIMSDILTAYGSQAYMIDLHRSKE